MKCLEWLKLSEALCFSWLFLLQLVINNAPSLMVVLGLKIAVLDLFLILFIKPQLLCRRFVPLNNSKIPTKDITLYNIFVSKFCWLHLSLLRLAFAVSALVFFLSLNFLCNRGYYISTRVKIFLTRVKFFHKIAIFFQLGIRVEISTWDKNLLIISP